MLTESLIRVLVFFQHAVNYNVTVTVINEKCNQLREATRFSKLISKITWTIVNLEELRKK